MNTERYSLIIAQEFARMFPVVFPIYTIAKDEEG